MQKLTKTIFAGALLLAISACSSLEFPGVYRVSVQQGNIVDKEMLDQLEVGMTQRQVRFVMGTPMIQDTFNPDRWDYYYSLRSGGNKLVTRHITLTFDGDVLAAIDGDVDSATPLPSPEEAQEEIEAESGAIPEDPHGDVVE